MKKIDKIYDLIIVGSGIVGLSTAYEYSKANPNRSILVIDKESEVAKHQTGNNSGVLHSGIYYNPGSLKAQNCKKGYELMVNFAKENNISFDICGKLIVASNKNELEVLNNIFENGKKNGLKGLTYLNPSQIIEKEPYCHGIAAVHVPQTGIINYKQICKVLFKLLNNSGTEVKFNQELIDLRETNPITVITKSDIFYSKAIVNCAGLHSDRVFRMTKKNSEYRIIPFRGEYYRLIDKKFVKNLIYPVPNPSFPFLGVHFTRTIDEEIEAGPNAVLAFKREGYKFWDFNFNDSKETFIWPGFWKLAFKYGYVGLGEIYRSLSKKAFTKALQKLIPEINESNLISSGSGVRAQVCDKNGNLVDDFIIEKTQNKIINVINAPSPAATSSFSIAQEIIKNLN